MEEATQISDENVTREGDLLDRDAPWVSPEVQAAQAGITVDFGKDLGPLEDPVEEEDDTAVNA